MNELFFSNKKVEPEPAPIPNGERAVWDLVITDMKSRDYFGMKKYGTRLQAFNGRDALTDAYQESLDMTVYLRQEIEERELTMNVVTEALQYAETGNNDDLIGAIEVYKLHAKGLQT